MNTQLFELKKIVKALAAEIKSQKSFVRECQSKESKHYHSKGFDFIKKFPSYPNDYFKLEDGSFVYNKIGYLLMIQKHFRLLHIAYCLLKGRTYEQIERYVHESNKLTESDWNEIRGFQNDFAS